VPRKKFEDGPYNPIEADLARDAATVSRRGSRSEMPYRIGQLAERGLDSHQRQGSGRTHHRSSKSEVAKRFTLTRDEDADLTEFLQRLQRQSNTKVALSMLIRVGLNLMMANEHEIISQMRKTPPPSQPATHDSLSYAEFELYWTQLIGESLRNASPFR
jgi:hypothetical protein